MPDITTEYLALRDQYIEARFARLNTVQRQAVFATEGPLLILAGAGSGKTTVLVNRIANIIRFGSAHGSRELPRPVTEADLNDLRTAVANGRDLPRETAYLAVRPARPWNVLAITFTNKAAGELKERLRAMLGDTLGGDVNASTFHSACVRMLRRDAERIGFPKNFTIYDSDDQQRVIKQIYKDLMIDDKFLPVKSAIAQISSFKDKLMSAEEVAGEPFANTKAQLISKIYTAYAGRLKTAGGGNNSAFTTRVVTSTGTDTCSAIASALCSLKGPRHGGANIRVRHMFNDLKCRVTDWTDDEQIEEYLAAILDKRAFDRSGLIYGMGHAVYSKSDPRATVLRSFVRALSQEKGREKECDLYMKVEEIAGRMIAEKRKIYKGVSANVDYYSGFVYDMLNLPEELYTPLFAVARISGWCAHRLEELSQNSKIIRPAYLGIAPRHDYVPLSERHDSPFPPAYLQQK